MSDHSVSDYMVSDYGVWTDGMHECVPGKARNAEPFAAALQVFSLQGDTVEFVFNNGHGNWDR